MQRPPGGFRTRRPASAGIVGARQARLAARARWLEGYGKACRDLASCRRVTEIGAGTADARIERVRRLHDELCRADTRLPLA